MGSPIPPPSPLKQMGVQIVSMMMETQFPIDANKMTDADLEIQGSSECCLNQYSSDPNERMDILRDQSEDLRQVEGEWRRFWMNDQPSHPGPDGQKGARRGPGHPTRCGPAALAGDVLRRRQGPP